MSSPYRVIDFVQIQVQLQVAPITAENLAPHLAAETARMRKDLEIHKQKGGPLAKVVVINDATCDLMPNPLARKVQAQWLKENEHLLRLVCHAVGFVIPSNALRTTLTAVFWLAPVPVPVVLHESLERALDWAITEVDHIGGEVPVELLMGGAQLIEQRKVAAGL